MLLFTIVFECVNHILLLLNLYIPLIILINCDHFLKSNMHKFTSRQLWKPNHRRYS